MDAVRSGRLTFRLVLIAAVMAVVAAMVAVAGASTGDDGSGAGFGASVDPTPIDTQSSDAECEELGFDAGFKVSPPAAGTFNVPGMGTITLTGVNASAGTLDSWTSTFGIDAVYMKGGSAGGNLYTYDPPAEVTADTDLVTSDNPNGRPAGISHITFCYDADPVDTGVIVVTKTLVAPDDVMIPVFSFDVSCETEGGTVEETFIYPDDFTAGSLVLQEVDGTTLTEGDTCTVTEQAPLPAGWTVSPSATINVTAGTSVTDQGVTAAFTNTYEGQPDPGAILITKSVVAPDGTAVPEFTFEVTCDTAIDGEAVATFTYPTDFDSSGNLLVDDVNGTALTVGDECSVAEQGPLPQGWSVSPAATIFVVAAVGADADGAFASFTNTYTPDEPGPGEIVITKTVVGGSGVFDFEVDCGNGRIFEYSYPSDFANGPVVVGPLPGGTACQVVEEFPNNDAESWITQVGGRCRSAVTVRVPSDTRVQVDFTNTLVDPYTGTNPCED